MGGGGRNGRGRGPTGSFGGYATKQLDEGPKATKYVKMLQNTIKMLQNTTKTLQNTTKILQNTTKILQNTTKTLSVGDGNWPPESP